MSRSTWACELKFLNEDGEEEIICHAPRERVSWNEKSGYKKGDKTVTLHVSVWVEMLIGRSLLIEQRVTLHVSVWVEILIPVP